MEIVIFFINRYISVINLIYLRHPSYRLVYMDGDRWHISIDVSL